MKSIIALFIVVVSLMMGLVHSECCGTKNMFFTVDIRQHSCYNIPGAKIYIAPGQGRSIGGAHTMNAAFLGYCEAEICGDGEVVSGTYCGVGGCNIFGCNCDGGCKRGNPGRNFVQKYGHITKDVYGNPSLTEVIFH